MRFAAPLAIAVAVAAAIAAIAPQIPGFTTSFVPLFAAIATATVITAALGSLAGGTAPTAAAPAPARGKPAASVPEGPREEGQVKWFNVSKGFGFIIKDNGDEIFVHFRSIRGEGRRSLRDGQRVTFVEAQSDKGPQAEDVEPL